MNNFLKYSAVFIMNLLFTLGFAALSTAEPAENNQTVAVLVVGVCSDPNIRFKKYPPVDVPVATHKKVYQRWKIIPPWSYETVPVKKFKERNPNTKVLCIVLLFSNSGTIEQEYTLANNVYLTITGKQLQPWEIIPAGALSVSPLRQVIDWYDRFPDYKPIKKGSREAQFAPKEVVDEENICLSTISKAQVVLSPGQETYATFFFIVPENLVEATITTDGHRQFPIKLPIGGPSLQQKE